MNQAKVRVFDATAEPPETTGKYIVYTGCGNTHVADYAHGEFSVEGGRVLLKVVHYHEPIGPRAKAKAKAKAKRSKRA